MAWEWVAPVSTGSAAVVGAVAVAWTAWQRRVHAERLSDKAVEAAAAATEAERNATRSDALDDRRREQSREQALRLESAAAELAARIDVVRDLYEALWYALDAGPDGWNSREAANSYHPRVTDAWVEYQRARAALRLIAPAEMDEAYAAVRMNLETLWLQLGDWYYTGTTKLEKDVQGPLDRVNSTLDEARRVTKEHVRRIHVEERDVPQKL